MAALPDLDGSTNKEKHDPLNGKKSESNYDDEEEAIDPRVQGELERLNASTDLINRLEVELDEARAAFRHTMEESIRKQDAMMRQLGSCVEKARPYYDSRMKAIEAQVETDKAAVRFERANSTHIAAKEMVYLAEQGLKKEGRTFDPAWQEMLNHATMKVNEAERDRTLSLQEHRKLSQIHTEAVQNVRVLQKQLKKNIYKSKSYFEMKAKYKEFLEEQKACVKELEGSIMTAKNSYAEALKNLEEISDEIHQMRRLRQEQQLLGTRSEGVGAEDPLLSLEQGTKRHMSTDEIYLSLPEAAVKNRDHQNIIPQAPVIKVEESTESEFKSLPNTYFKHVDEPLDLPISSEDQLPKLEEENNKIAKDYRPSLQALTLNIPRVLTLAASSEDEMSDTESLASCDMLDNDQITYLFMDHDFDDVYQDFPSTCNHVDSAE